MGDRRANNAAVYPQLFVDEILKALRKHIRASHFPVVELKDRWEVRHNQLICRHFQPRQQLCTLEECEEFDFPVKKFTGKRTTTKTYEDGSAKQSVDDWRFHTSTTTSSAAQRWTGTTAFDLIIEVMLPADYQNRATWISAAAAHPIQEYVTAEGAFQSEWCATRKLFDRAVPSAHSDGRATRIPKEEGHERGDEQRVDQELRSRVLPEKLGRGDQEGDDQLHPELRRELYRVHRNLGHPDLSTFVRGLRHAGAKRGPGLGEEVFQVPVVRKTEEAWLTTARSSGESHGFQRVHRHRPLLHQGSGLLERGLPRHESADRGDDQRQDVGASHRGPAENVVRSLWSSENADM